MTDSVALIDAWIQYHKESRASRTSGGPLFWAWEEVQEVVYGDPEVALTLVMAILARDEEGVVMEILAAGSTGGPSRQAWPRDH